jgi:hypothetical protein
LGALANAGGLSVSARSVGLQLGPAIGGAAAGQQQPAAGSSNPQFLSSLSSSLALHGIEQIEHEGWLYKVRVGNATVNNISHSFCTRSQVGQRVKTLRKRWYYLQQNFLYWYSNHTEGEPRGVLFLEGSYVKRTLTPSDVISI